MTRRRSIWLGLSVVVAVVFGAEFYVLWPDTGPMPINRQADYERIHVGMTYAEVEQILGKDRGFIPEGRAMVASSIGPRPGSWGSTWFGNDMVVQVWFADQTDRVSAKEFRPVIRMPQQQASLLLWLRQRLKL